MKLTPLIMILLLVSCGKKDAAIVLPGDEASVYEAEVLYGVVDKIQSDFDELGVNVNLRSIPYHVVSLAPDIAGICVYKSNGTPVGIAVNHSIINNWVIEDPSFYGLIYKTLLHEIGHCFFQRAHDDDHFRVPGKSMMINEHPMNEIEVSLMIDGGRALVLKALWPYYVREIAGYDRINSLTDLERYARVNLY